MSTELITALTALITAVGVVITQIRILVNLARNTRTTEATHAVVLAQKDQTDVPDK